jgi:hypothetical protein
MDDFMDFIETDHCANRHDDAYLDSFDEGYHWRYSGYNTGKKASCRHCGRPIKWKQIEGHWIAHKPTGKPHVCAAMKRHFNESALSLLDNLDTL